MTTATPYAFGTVLDASIEITRQRVEAELKEQGFGILTEIDVRATMRAKLGIEGEPCLILGAEVAIEARQRLLAAVAALEAGQ